MELKLQVLGGQIDQWLVSRSYIIFFDFLDIIYCIVRI